MKTDKLNPELVDKIDPELMEGEDLLWVGKPQPWRVLFSSGDRSMWQLVAGITSMLVMLFIGVVMFASASTTTVTSTGTETVTVGGSIAPMFWMIIAISMLSTFAMPLWKYIQAHRTLYALTNRRAIIMEGNSVQSYSEKDMELIERKMSGNGKGDLIFKYNFVSRRHGRSNRRRTYKMPVGFFGIDHVRAVEAMMLRTFGFEEEGYEKPKRLSYDNDDLYETDESGYAEDAYLHDEMR